MPYDFYKVKYGTKVMHDSGAQWMFPHDEVSLHMTGDSKNRLIIRQVSSYIIRLEIPAQEIGLVDGWSPIPNPNELFQRLIDVFGKEPLPIDDIEAIPKRE
jgi:hypothetical protein